MGSIFSSHWPKSYPNALVGSIIIIIANSIDYPPQPDYKTLLINIPHTYVIKDGEIEPMTIRSFTLMKKYSNFWEVIYLIEEEKNIL